MAIQTVTNENVGAFVAERKARGSNISDAVNPTEAKVDGVATPGNPVIKEGVAETIEGAPPDPGKQIPTAKAKGSNPVQPRIDELTREKYELEEFAQSEYERRLALEEELASVKAAKPAPPAPTPIEEALKRPSPKDFTDQDAYDAAMTEYENKRDERTAAKAAAAARAEALAQEQNRIMAQRIEAAKAELPDFQEVIERADKRTRADIPNHIKAAILESEKGAYLAYHLAKDPAEEKRIFALSPACALMELGRIEDTFKPKNTPATSQNGNSAPVETSKAPAPVTQVRSEGAGIVRQDLSKPQPFAQYKQARMEELRARKRH